MADNKQIIRDAMEAMNRGDMDAFDSIVADDYVCHDPIAGNASLDEVKQQMRQWGAAFPEGTMELQEVIGDGDLVAARWSGKMKHSGAWMGKAPTGRWCTMEGLALYRFENGKIVEEWDQYDVLGVLRQLGVVEFELPSQGTAPAAAAEARPQG